MPTLKHLVNGIHHAHILRPVIMAAKQAIRLKQCSPRLYICPTLGVIVIRINKD